MLQNVTLTGTLNKSRRAIAGFALAALVAAALMPMLAANVSAQRKTGPAEVPVDELMKPGDLPDITLGPADAKVTVVEYASLTCPHCAAFATKVFPEFKTKYIDTNKIRYVFRGFALNPLDSAAQMLVQCLDPSKHHAMVDAFYDKQAEWAFGNSNPVPKLFEMSKQAGFTQEAFDKCLKDQAMLDKVNGVRTRASEVFGVSATPTFFVNGKRLQEVPSLENLAKLIDPLL